ncbi:MAG: fused MFS/spermidine synthase [Myxococcota bacterium]
MDDTPVARARSVPVVAAVVASGAAGLSWELVFHHRASLALGASTYGAAVTLATVIGGLGLGGLWAARWARRPLRPLRAYATAELVVGVGGLVAPYLLAVGQEVDSAVWSVSPFVADLLRPLLTGLAFLPPAVAMGATIPFLAPIARRSRAGLAWVYGANTFGAIVGTLMVSFVAIPSLGVRATEGAIAAVNLAVAGWGFWAARETLSEPEAEHDAPPLHALALAGLTGVAAFTLEVSWFRSIRAALQNTTETFGIVLSAFLLALAVGAFAARWVAKRSDSVPLALMLAGALVIGLTSRIDALDRATRPAASLGELGDQLLLIFGLFVGPIACLGVVFPVLLERHPTTGGSGRLLAVNTLGSMAGALVTGFVLLPLIGASVTSVLVGAVLALVGLALSRVAWLRIVFVVTFGLGVFSFVHEHDGGAQARVQGFASYGFGEVLYVAEGPDATVWVTRETRSGVRKLVIDGFEASGEDGISEYYMRWMGALPTLGIGRLRRALVICFGTGQTARALRDQGPAELEIAELSAAVLDAADFFETNDEVLKDPRVTAHVMDGRALLRRGAAPYDVVTLEPMPPNFAGSNNLYSVEFYELVAKRLAEGGLAAQWLPIHLISERHMRAIVGSFVSVFPHSRLWLDPEGGTGILVGGQTAWEVIPGRQVLGLGSAEIAQHFLLAAPELRTLAGNARVTDDNQLLAFGSDRFAGRVVEGTGAAHLRLYHHNLEVLRRHAQSDVELASPAEENQQGQRE